MGGSVSWVGGGGAFAAAFCVDVDTIVSLSFSVVGWVGENVINLFVNIETICKCNLCICPSSFRCDNAIKSNDIMDIYFSRPSNPSSQKHRYSKHQIKKSDTVNLV